MAAYAALTSLKHIIHNLENHPSPPISIDKQQVQSLTENVTSLQEFLRGYNSHLAHTEEADPLETQIADAAYEAEDVIESKIVDRIRGQSTTPTGDDLYRDLQQAIQKMAQIRKTIHTDNTAVRPQLPKNVSKGAGASSTSFSSGKKMVGFDDVFRKAFDSLTGSKSGLQILPIVGMGGIGKTTLARTLFEDASIKEHFNFRAWTTISQDYNAQQALKEILSQAKENSSDKSEDELGKELYQYLLGRSRYLIVLDDMWSLDVWNKIRHYFPDNGTKSRIVVTTRISNLATHFNHSLNMKLLDEDSSWNLFSRTVFGGESFPPALEDIGRNIVRNCRGLPLSIVTIGSLLAKLEHTLKYWEYVEGNLSSIVNLEGNEYCLRVLKMSYNHLPAHLKPCFLYMGVFEEDQEINVSKLMKLWVSEGFLEQIGGKSLEITAKENLKDLVDRNLVLVHKLGSNGKIKICKIHDLVRDMCLREAMKERFFCVVGKHIPQGVDSVRRIFIHRSTSKEIISEALQSVQHARSFVYDYYLGLVDQMPLNFRLLRTFEGHENEFNSTALENVFELVNLRHLRIGAYKMSRFPSSFNLFWNLHFLIFSSQISGNDSPIEIWNLPHLRHVGASALRLTDPLTDNVVVMENLHALKTVLNFKFNQEVAERIPNIKRLAIRYTEIESNADDYCLNYLTCLDKLESFQCSGHYLKNHDILKKLIFPQSLKKLSLDFSDEFELEEMLEKIGSLRLLQKLALSGGLFATGEWKIAEDKFLNLKFLRLWSCRGLRTWTSEGTPFPCIEEIHLFQITVLEEIPSEIGDIPTLQKITLDRCSMSAVVSAHKILKEQEESQGPEKLFHVQVILPKLCDDVFEVYRWGGNMEVFRWEKERDEQRAQHNLSGPNFKVI